MNEKEKTEVPPILGLLRFFCMAHACFYPDSYLHGSVLPLPVLLTKRLMNRLSKYFALLLIVAIMCFFSFWLGKHQGDRDTFRRGAELEKERAALFRAADSNLLVKLFDSGRTDELRGFRERYVDLNRSNG